MIGVMTVDDDPLVRAWIKAALRRSEFRVAAEAGSVTAATALLERRKLDLLLVDFRLPDGFGLDFVRDVRRRGDTTPAILMTAAVERGLNERAHEAGFQATLLKTTDRDDLHSCLRGVLGGRGTFDPQHPRRPADVAPLSNREREILSLLGAGRTNREIAAGLGIGEETVKTYLERLYKKLGVQRRTEAVGAAHRLGLLGR